MNLLESKDKEIEALKAQLKIERAAKEEYLSDLTKIASGAHKTFASFGLDLSKDDLSKINWMTFGMSALTKLKSIDLAALNELKPVYERHAHLIK